MSGGWFGYSLVMLLIAGIATGLAAGKVSAGVAVFFFGFALGIWADEIAGSDKNRKK